MSAAEGKAHDTPDATEGGPDDGAFDWFRVLDVAVWVAIAVIVILATEWFFGLLARESIARSAQKFLRKQEQTAG